MQMLQGFNPQAGMGQLNSAMTSALSGKAPMMVSQNLPQGYLQNALITPMMHQFQTQIAPQIKEGFGNVGAFSSAQGSALGNALGQLTASATQQYGQAQLAQQQLAQQLNVGSANAAMQRQVSALPFAQAQSLLPLQQMQGIQSLLAPYQTNLANQAQAQYQNFLRTAPENSPWTQLAMGITGQQQQALYNPVSPLSNVLGTIGGLGAAATGINALGGAVSSTASGLGSLLGGLGLLAFGG